MAKIAKSAIITKVELNSEGTHYVLTTDTGATLPWLPLKYVENWLVRNMKSTYKPNQAMKNSIVEWNDMPVKKDQPVLTRKGEPVLDAVGNQVLYTKDHTRVEDLVIYPSEELDALETKMAAKASVKIQMKQLSPMERAKQALAAKQAARAASQAATNGGSQGTPAALTLDESLELSPEQQAEMAAQALAENPATV